jgi:hypothetical protein
MQQPPWGPEVSVRKKAFAIMAVPVVLFPTAAPPRTFKLC